ncbi:YjbE family integral membrane protein [Stella humosa]|uniref:YjbE family integral membrane protein n=1 Tax=Stella humosa TaxID=94 RepID=A0A3N1M9Z7_9PROT|nr:TerC family protein [Stella humosa]ROQ00513.1 YjbE family integral membrane protein [Stella humosa]BBK30243.1 membrane protein [Stella humosa]
MDWGQIFSAEAMVALGQVLLIDLVLAGDNAIAVGLAAAGLPKEQRGKVILIGIAAATVMRIGFAAITSQLLQVIGLMLAGGVLLLWVCWKMWRELRSGHEAEEAHAEELLDEATGGDAATTTAGKPRKTFAQAAMQIVAADISMSLDNVLAVAGAARDHPWVLVTGLVMSVAFMGLAAAAIASLLQKYRWIAYVGLAMVLYVALKMIWDGSQQVLLAVNPV